MRNFKKFMSVFWGFVVILGVLAVVFEAAFYLGVSFTYLHWMTITPEGWIIHRAIFAGMVGLGGLFGAIGGLDEIL